MLLSTSFTTEYTSMHYPLYGGIAILYVEEGRLFEGLLTCIKKGMTCRVKCIIPDTQLIPSSIHSWNRRRCFLLTREMTASWYAITRCGKAFAIPAPSQAFFFCHHLDYRHTMVSVSYPVRRERLLKGFCVFYVGTSKPIVLWPLVSRVWLFFLYIRYSRTSGASIRLLSSSLISDAKRYKMPRSTASNWRLRCTKVMTPYVIFVAVFFNVICFTKVVPPGR